ncbi:MAG: YebC/PmpR family DNA-binding transcriptional regulator [Phycisphaera sp.]|nr:YebC/PmpR family DNA-binding transcriptional regulator [Phycisphaera sp.]
MAGHSKWANIKHRKARQDAKKSKMWSKCAKAIMVAARAGGGDPSMNLTLRYAIDDAKAENMPKDNIENAIKKGSGELGAENIESVVYEGYAPGGVAILIDCLTDNKNRTVGELRTIFSKGGGNLGTSGSVSYLFTPKGVITLAKDAADEERIMEIALEAGADDVSDEGEVWRVSTEPAAYHAVRGAFEEAGLEFDAELTMEPANTIEVAGKTAQQVLNMMDLLEDHDDVQKVFANFDISEDELAAME